jgi:sugar lactone lactonase YvrE
MANSSYPTVNTSSHSKEDSLGSVPLRGIGGKIRIRLPYTICDRFGLPLFAFSVLGLTTGCVGSSTDGVAADPTPTTSLTVYAKGATGDVAPVRSIAGPRTGLMFPSAIAVDGSGDRYVADRTANSVSVYSSSAQGDAAPIRTIAGTYTGLNLPTGLALDAHGDIYVVNRAADTITIYSSTANGNAAPIRIIEGPTTDLNEPTSIAIDHEQRMYVSNLADRSVTVFAPDASGDAAPVRVIRGKRTELTAAFAIAVDSAGYIYVVNADDTNISGVLVFSPHAKDNVAPARVIAGSATGLHAPSGVAIDPSGAAFVSDHGVNGSAGAVHIFAKRANGNVAPLYSISGAATRMRPYGITIESTGAIDLVNQKGQN